jgi:hypothetical protein
LLGIVDIVSVVVSIVIHIKVDIFVYVAFIDVA